MRLEAIQKDWQECEDDIEEILAWLKNIRSILAADIPHTYDDLQSGLSKCKVHSYFASCKLLSDYPKSGIFSSVQSQYGHIFSMLFIGVGLYVVSLVACIMTVLCSHNRGF